MFNYSKVQFSVETDADLCMHPRFYLCEPREKSTYVRSFYGKQRTNRYLRNNIADVETETPKRTLSGNSSSQMFLSQSLAQIFLDFSNLLTDVRNRQLVEKWTNAMVKLGIAQPFKSCWASRYTWVPKRVTNGNCYICLNWK